MRRGDISLQQILSFLEKEGVDFSIDGVSSENQKLTFQLASTRHVINKGIYYLCNISLDNLPAITDSIILTDCQLPVVKNNIVIVVENPQLIHYKLAAGREERPKPMIHPTAIVHPEAEISPGAHIGPYCILGKCKIGDNVVLMGTVTVNSGCEIMQNSIVESHTVIGARGMAWIWDENGNRVMQPQSGGVIIEEDCIIGTGISIVRGSLSENTIIGRGTVMAHGTKIGHGAVVGELVHFANNVSLAGNTNIGKRVFLGSACVVSSNVSIADGCIIGAGAVVHRSVEESNCTLAGVPAVVIQRNNFESKPKGAPKPFRKTKNDE